MCEIIHSLWVGRADWQPVILPGGGRPSLSTAPGQPAEVFIPLYQFLPSELSPAMLPPFLTSGHLFFWLDDGMTSHSLGWGSWAKPLSPEASLPDCLTGVGGGGDCIYWLCLPVYNLPLPIIWALLGTRSEGLVGEGGGQEWGRAVERAARDAKPSPAALRILLQTPNWPISGRHKAEAWEEGQLLPERVVGKIRWGEGGGKQGTSIPVQHIYRMEGGHWDQRLGVIGNVLVLYLWVIT